MFGEMESNLTCAYFSDGLEKNHQLALVETGIFENKLLRLNNLASSPWKHRGSLQCQIVGSPGSWVGGVSSFKVGPKPPVIP